MTVETTRSRFDEAKVDAIFATLDQCHKPGAAVAIAIGGEPVYRKGFGRANMELPTLLSTTIRMRIGSTTKHFACLAYLLLCEEGKAGLDDAIGTHVAGLQPVTAAVTMRQLMTHTGGVRDLLALTLFSNGLATAVSDRELLDYYRTIETVDFPAGTAWNYDNGGYMLLAAAIEAVAGQPLDQVLRERIFLPAGMHDTVLRRWDRDFLENSATLHMIDGKGGFTRDHMAMELSATGGVVSTMDDMLRWLKQLSAPVVGSAETWRLMLEPQLLESGHSTGYGLGLMLLPYRGVATICHAGGVVGGNSQMITVPSAGLDISIAVNRADANATDLAFKVIDLLVEDLEPLPEKVANVPVEGLFVSPTSGRVVELSAKDDTQLFALDGAAPLPVERDAGGALQLPVPVAFLQTSFVTESATLIEFGNADAMRRIDPDRAVRLGERAGRYRSEEIDTMIEVSEGRMIVRGRHGTVPFGLTPLTGRIWRLAGEGAMATVAGIMTFDEDGQGLEITFTRLKRLRFARG